MAVKVAKTQLNARTIDIVNAIRQNLGYSYQAAVPAAGKEYNLVAVGDIILGNPTLANQFLNELINQIALVRVKSNTFNNKLARLKKGYLEYGETVEEVFVEMAKAREFSVEKAAARELRRTPPDVRAAFHNINYRAQYAVSVQYEDLRQAFARGDSGMETLIAKIMDSTYRGAEYDEYLLVKYMLIKAFNKGAIKKVVASGDMTADAAIFRGTSNKLLFPLTEYNYSGVHVDTQREFQNIFMGAEYNGAFDVNVLASAFNMDKANFSGQLTLVDDWDSFDNERFAEIVENSDQMEAVTAAELAAMKTVKAMIIDSEWFQIYDNLINFSEDKVAAGMYWNYFLNIWKTVSWSPFSNAVAFVTSNDAEQPMQSFTASISTYSANITGEYYTDATGCAIVFTSKDYDDFEILQSENLTTKNCSVCGRAILCGSYEDAEGEDIEVVVKANGATYKTVMPDYSNINDPVTFTLKT